jgi:predicted metalloprotease with PDZ domain
MHRFRFAPAFAAACLTTALAFAAPASNTAARPIELAVDATDAPRGVFHSRLVIPAAPGVLTLAYPKWVQGEHAPTGPVMQVAGLTVTAGGKTLPWRRDPLDMFLVRVEVPAGATAVEVAFDYLSPSAGFGAGYGETPNATPHLLIADWHDLVVYPLGPGLDAVPVRATLRLPAGWQHDSSLAVAGEREGTVSFAPTTLYTLLDAPVLAGDLFRTIEVGPAERISLAADRRSSLAVPEARIAAYRRLPGEAQALFGGKHYRNYHWLVAISEPLEHNGLEHHESSDNRGVAGMFTDENDRVRSATLLAHEYVHSWNGKYRRPAGLAVRDAQEPLQTELLWVYEGLTRYLGDLVLSSRTGIWTPEQSHEFIAYVAANQDHNRPGRSWRPLVDTAVAVQSLGSLPPGWTAYRRTLDYYDESMLIWLEADTILREKSGGKRSLDDFCRAFFGGDQPSAPPTVIPYTADDLYAALGRVAPYDWRGFFAARVEAVNPRAPLAGLEAAGWKLVYDDTPNTYQSARAKGQKIADASLSLGLWIKSEDGAINDVVVGAPAWEAGLGPGMKITAINGRKWSTDVLAEELAAKPDMEITAEQGEELRTFRIVHHGGPRWPHLVRDETKPDRLKEILAPRTGG